MRGGLRSPVAAVGGLARTYGLQHHFSKDDGAHGRPGPRLGDMAIWRRILAYFLPYKWRWLVVVGCILVSAGLNVIPPLCVAGILDHALPSKNGLLLVALTAAMVGLAVVSGLIGVLQQSLTARLGQGILFDIRTQLFRHLQRMSLRFYITTRAGEIVSRVNNDVNAVQNIATTTFVSIIGNLATLAAASIAMFSMNWRLTLLAIVVVPAFYFPSRVVGRIRRRLSKDTQETQSTLLTFLNERLHASGAVLTRIYGQTETEARTFGETSARLRELRVRQAVVGRWLFMILGVFSAAGPALVYAYGGFQVMSDNLTPGLLVAFVALLTLLYRPLVQLATIYVDIQGAMAVFERIFDYLDLDPEVPDPRKPARLSHPPCHVCFENVYFTYPAQAALTHGRAESTRHAPALEGVSFEIPAGNQVALVGPSGAGKSTLTYLLPRFYDPLKGKITLDGVDLRQLAQEELRRHIAMVPQETFLFHASIRENLRYAAPGASEKALIAACEAAHIHEFIAGLPQGYETIVGERGFRLSGGEKQRLSIARAILKNPSILILDEATSSLDTRSEGVIRDALQNLLRGRTSLIIAHRLSTVLHADMIVVLDRGRVVDAGRHDELLARGGLYRQLFLRQFATHSNAANGSEL